MFSDKKILVGVTGGIAAYKTCEVIRYLIKNNAQVKVVMTDAAKKFISTLTFETLTDNAVHYKLFDFRFHPRFSNRQKTSQQCANYFFLAYPENGHHVQYYWQLP